MSNQIQAAQAQAFNCANHHNIEKAKQKLAAAVRLFFMTAGKGVLPATTEKVILANLDRGALSAVGLQLRHNQTVFIAAQVSMLVWDLVDSESAIGDATGDSAPYMTMDRREHRLIHSGQHLDDFHVMLPAILTQQQSLAG